jgi:hypothetical protein
MESLIRQIEELENACCVWEVQAGRAPDKPEPGLTRSWSLTQAEWQSPHGMALFAARMTAALDYAARLHVPRRVGWVRVDCRWR